MNQVERESLSIPKWTRREFVKAAVLSGIMPLFSACDALLQHYDVMTGAETMETEPSIVENTIQPPIYPSTLELAAKDEVGERLVISGTIYANDMATPLPEAVITVWQTDANGEYGRLRAALQSDQAGRFELRTIRPGHYQVEDITRAAHIHFVAEAVGMRARSGEILFDDDPYLTTDPVILEEDPAIIAERVISLSLVQGADGPYYQGEFNLVLQSW